MDILKTGKDIRRLNEIVNILIKYGFGDMIRRIGLAESIEKAGKLVRYQISADFMSMEPPERMRHAMEEMGPTFIKLGQILATRVDLFAPDWIRELEKMQDSNTALPFSVIQALVENSIGKPTSEAFHHIDEKPLGTASMAQVHRAVTLNGEEVVLKVRKPNIREKIEADLRLLHYLASIAQSQSQELRRYRPIEIVREFEKSLLRELDFSIESKNAERIAESLKHIPYVKIPKVYWEWTGEDMNVQEFVRGISAKNTKELEAAGLDRQLLATRGAKIVWQTMLVDGFFHADPHPGNFLILPRNRIAMLDFGMVGKLSVGRREQLMKLTRSIVLQDTTAVAAVMLEWSDGNADFDTIHGEAEDFISRYYGVPLSKINIQQVIADATDILRTFNITLPSDIAMFSKACLTLEGFGRLLNPNFDLMKEAEPLIKQWGKDYYNPVTLAKRLTTRALNIVDKIYEEPKPPIVTQKSAGNANGLDRPTVERLVKHHELLRYRQTNVFACGCLVVAFAMLCLAEKGPQLLGFSVIGLLGFLGSVGALYWQLFLMWWSHRNGE
ncbi:ABC1 family protein, ubiquinone biosynthesis protein [gamma proteobacterium HdN1]|nr:ABC1 family protein, ubiquinone biosynthesis protein [gamma proteobacterium HdN1]